MHGNTARASLRDDSGIQEDRDQQQDNDYYQRRNATNLFQ